MRRLEVRERRSLREAKGLRWKENQWGDLGRIFARGREGLKASVWELWGDDFSFLSTFAPQRKAECFSASTLACMS